MTVRRVLVTGAQGLLGRRLVAAFLAVGDEVLGIGRSARRNRHYTHDLEWCGRRLAAPLGRLRPPGDADRYHYRSVDLRDGDALATVRDFAPQIVVHSAAALRDESWSDLAASNVASVFGVFDAAPTAERIVVVSSGSVYGPTPEALLPHRTDHPCRPGDLYAVSKRTSEDVGRVLGAERGVVVQIARVFNLLGPALQDRHLAGSLAGQLAAIHLGLTPPRVEMGDLVTTRDFIDVRDAADAIVALVAADPDPERTVVNVASGIETPVRRVFDELAEIAGVGDRLTVVRRPPRPVDLPRSYADVAELDAVGFRPRHTLSSSLRDMFEYHLDWRGDDRAVTPD